MAVGSHRRSHHRLLPTCAGMIPLRASSSAPSPPPQACGDGPATRSPAACTPATAPSTALTRAALRRLRRRSRLAACGLAGISGLFRRTWHVQASTLASTFTVSPMCSRHWLLTPLSVGLFAFGGVACDSGAEEAAPVRTQESQAATPTASVPAEEARSSFQRHAELVRCRARAAWTSAVMRTERRRARAPSWSRVDARPCSQILDAAVAGLLGHVDVDRVPAGQQCRVGVVAAEGDLYRVVAGAVQAVLGSVRPAT